MKPSIPLAALACAALLSSVAHAEVTVQDAWVRGTVAQQKSTGAFMKITASEASRLVAVSTPVAGVAEIHEMKLVGDVMKMRAVPHVDLPAGRVVELKPGGYHLMLMQLKAPVSAGATVPLTLTVETAAGTRTTIDVQAPVRALAGEAAGNAGGGHMHKGH